MRSCADDMWRCVHRLEIFAFFMLTGIFSTFLIKETKLQSLEELSNEKQEGFIDGQCFSWPLNAICPCLTFRLTGTPKRSA